ncbi:hypothetical protein JYK02_15325 [Corallococcus macrosporus]|uniref:Tetratricopeptide repeat protein n=1 Tax=Corallococcus macrosporus TaxID=35 RepID=A0ABS3DB08_9BACT|nr:hypothetical protein [Corallococcus macrosporus]MBN8228879.1 hypothetical protein [Corallococcus macrosporus]
MGSRGEDVRGAEAQVCRDAARLLREGQAARAYSGLVSASRSLPMTPRLAAVLVRCALRAGTERAVITLLDAAMVTERGEVRREVRRQLSRVLRRTGQEARAAAVLNGLLMDAPDDARARFVLDVLRERVAKAKDAPSQRPPLEDEESRTKTVEVSALALSDPELGNTVVEMPVVQAPPARVPRADTVQVPLGEWAGLGQPASRGPEFPWDDEGPGKARVATPPRGARSVPEPERPRAQSEGNEASGERASVEPSSALPSVDATSKSEAESASAVSVSSPVDATPKAESGTAADASQTPSSAVVASDAARAASSAVAASDAAQAPESAADVSSASASAETERGATASINASSANAVELSERGIAASFATAADQPASSDTASGAAPSTDVPAHVIAALSTLLLSDETRTAVPQAPEHVAATTDTAAASESKAVEATTEAAQTPEPKSVAAPNAPPLFESTQVFGKKLEEEAKPAPDESTAERMPPRPLVSVLVPGAPPSKAFDADESTSEMLLPPRPAEAQAKDSSENAASEDLHPRQSEPAGAQARPSGEDASASKKTSPRQPDAVLVPGGPSKGFDADKATSEVIPPRPSSGVLVPGAPAMAFDEDEATSEIIPPERGEAGKGTSASAQSQAEKPTAPRRASVLVPSTAKPAFDEEESTSEVVFPQPDSSTPQAPAADSKRDSPRLPAAKPPEPSQAPDAASSLRTSDEGSERAWSQRQEAQLIARRAWRELAQLYLKRADRAKDAPERAEALTRLAEVMENELQDSAGAARMYREIVELTGERTALREQVRLLSQREDASLVRRALDDAIARARTSRARAVALLTRGERQLNMGVPAKAREDFEAADALVPGMLPVLAGLVRSVSDEERFAQVERLRAACAAAPRRAPDRLEALRVLAQTAEESLGDLRIAQWAWAEVLAESPDNEQPREHLLALARRLGDLPALSQLLHAQLAREPRGPAARKAHLERVATLEAMGDAGAALAELRQAVRFEPGHKEAWLLLADRCTEREQFGEAAWALENAATATEDDEERQRTWERLALFCREVLHNTEKARLYARRAESLRKSREQRARPPPPEPARTAPPQNVGVPPPSVLVAPPSVLVPSKRKDFADEVTSNTDVPSLLDAEEAAAEDAPGKRSSRAKDGAARKAKASSEGAQPKAPSGRHVGAAPSSTESPRQPKAPSGSHSPVGSASSSTEAPRQPKAPSGRHAAAGAPASSAEASRQPKGPVEQHASSSTATPNADAIRQPKAPSGRHAPVGSTAPNTDAARQPKAPSGRHPSIASTSPEAEPSRRSASTKAPTESPASLAESAPAPSGMARAMKPARGAASEPAPTPDDGTSDRKQRTPPRESTTAFGAPLPQDADLEAAVSRKAAPSEDNASPAARAPKNAGTQIREAPSRSERVPRAGHAPRLPLSASGVEPPAPPRAPLSASGVEPPAPAPRAMAGASRPVAPPSKGRGAPEAPPDIPLLSQIPSEDEDEDAQELGDGPVEATSVIAWEAPPGRMDPVRRIHRAGRPEGTFAGPAPTRPPASGRPTVGSTETRETPAAVPDAAPPADATSAEPIVFKLVRERPLDPKPYRGLVDHFDQRGDVTRAALMRELADALEGRDVPAPRVQRGPLSNQERAGLRHPGLRTPSGELLACVGIALCRLFPSPARIASTSEPLRASSGPGAAAVLDALNGAARLLGVPLPELVAGDDDTANITPLHTTAPRLVVGRLLVQQPPTNAELRFHAGRALFSLSPDLLALRALRKDHLLRALALLSSVLKNPKDAGDDARVVRESLSPKALERAALLMEPGTRDFDASLLVAAARDSANRAGLVACGGPGAALTVLRARRPHDSELEELVRFAASERYLALRDAAEAGRPAR